MPFVDDILMRLSASIEGPHFVKLESDVLEIKPVPSAGEDWHELNKSIRNHSADRSKPQISRITRMFGKVARWRYRRILIRIIGAIRVEPLRAAEVLRAPMHSPTKGQRFRWQRVTP